VTPAAPPVAAPRLRLLLVAGSWPEPPLTGALQRWWAMIRHLGSRHDLTLVAFASAGQDWNRPDVLRFCRAAHVVRYGGPPFAGAETLPYLVWRRASERMRHTLTMLAAEPFDAVLLEQIFLAPYRDLFTAPVILGEHNIESRALERAVANGLQPLAPFGIADSAAEARRLGDYEDDQWPRFAVRTAVSDVERRAIQARARHGRTVLVENGTDAGLWLPDARSDTDTLLFTGALDYFPNVDALRHFHEAIWPHIRRRHATCRLIVAGRSPADDVRAWCTEPGVTLVENPADLRTVARGASVSIAPLRCGAGSRLKILDSMALGLPVVTTSLGCEGLAVADETHALIRDDPQAFAGAVVRLLRDPAAWTTLRTNGRLLIDARYTWDRTLRGLDEALTIALDAAPAPSLPSDVAEQPSIARELSRS
jgi:glycosyltransferase involved in cell wall biosynthesis